jgi:threonine dehydratase
VDEGAERQEVPHDAGGVRAVVAGAALIDLAHIQAARERIRTGIHKTPLLRSGALGEAAGIELFLKCECFQKTGSFKARGALHKVLSLTEAERARGAVTVSAGNHAAAVTWAARQAGVAAVVVMPPSAPRAKIEAVRGYGAEIVFHEDRATLFDRLREVESERGLTFVHPFDDPVVLAGAGTCGLEIVEELPEVDTVVVPLGGGGLLGGVATAVRGLRPSARIVAVELAEGPGMGPALSAGKPVPVTRPAGTVADGMTPPFVGALPLEIVLRAGVDVVGVTEAAIRDAMREVMTRAKLVVEGSGAAAVAAILSGVVRLDRGSRVAAIVSGGNIDLERLSEVLG